MAEYLIQSETLDDIADAINAKTGGSSAMTPAQMVTAIGSIETGGGGVQVVASGTVQGQGTHQIDIPVGTKMPECDFEFCVYAPSNTEFGYHTDYNFPIAWSTLSFPKSILKFDLSQNGICTLQSPSGYTVNNDGTIVTPTTFSYYQNFLAVNGSAFKTLMTSVGTYNYIQKSASGFVVHLNINNWMYVFDSGITYNWHVKYYGNDPTNDIVEVT